MAGAEITLVTEDSAAARAGLQADDVIVAIDDRRVLNPGSLRATHVVAAFLRDRLTRGGG
jgi:S1-C subfamily serine protease